MSVLYRKYRPQKFSEVVGQEHIVKTLTNQLKNQNIAHAYLFTGPRGVGKTSIARILARSVNCLAQDGHEPDNQCDVCKEILENRSLDLAEIDAASHTGVDNIRDIIDHISVPPTKSKYRIFIIDEVHMLSRGAFNALLKTLEEPPAHVLFILATTEVHKIPATILSRTQRYDFRKFTPEQIQGHLQKIADAQNMNVPAEVLQAISESVDGGMRDALVSLEKASHLASQQEVSAEELQKLLGVTPIKFRKEFLEFLLNKDLEQIAIFLKTLASDGYNLEQFNRDFLEHVRAQMSVKMNTEHAQIADNFLKAHQQLKVSPVAELPLMVAAIKSIEQGSNEAIDQESKSIQQPPKKVSAQVNNQKRGEFNQVKSNHEHVPAEAVQERWLDILGKVRHYNQSLLSALKLAQPVGTMNGSLTIAFPYKFHAETVNAAKNRLVIERVLEEIFGHKIAVQCIAQSDAAPVIRRGGMSDDDAGSAKSKEARKQLSNEAEEISQEDANKQVTQNKDDDLVKAALDVFGD